MRFVLLILICSQGQSHDDCRANPVTSISQEVENELACNSGSSLMSPAIVRSVKVESGEYLVVACERK